jgi:hypothetical protein
MVKIIAYLDMALCCLLTAYRYCKVTFRDDVFQCRIARLFDDGIHTVLEHGIEQYRNFVLRQ